MPDLDENIFPEEGFPVGGEEPAPEVKEPEIADEENTPWLKFIEKYPQYMNEPLPEGMEGRSPPARPRRRRTFALKTSGSMRSSGL